jgi:hypothetical protein
MTDDPNARMDDEGAPPLPEPEPPRPTVPITTEATAQATEGLVVTPEARRRKLAGRLGERDRLVPILVASTALLLVATVLLGLMVFAPRIAPVKVGATKLAARGQEEQEIVAVARRFAKNFLTVDYRTIDADFDRVIADVTPSFKSELEKVIELSEAQFKEHKATSKGQVNDTLVISRTEDNAVVRTVVERSISNAETRGRPESGQQVLDITLAKTSGGWKVDQLQELQSQAPGG